MNKSGFLFILLICLLGACSQHNSTSDLNHMSGLTMGTLYSVKYVKQDAKVDDSHMATEINDLLRGLENILSTYEPGSEISHFNQSSTTEWIAVSDSFFEVIQTGIEANRLTDGRYDFTVGHLVNLWGFGPEHRKTHIPAEDEIETALHSSGIKYLLTRRQPRSIKKLNPALYLDLSGIAKGYAAMVIADLLESSEIQNYLIDIGGEIIAKGKNEDHQPWRIAIETPDSADRNPILIVDLENMGVATSGSYRNYFENNKVRYSHLIDPVHGKPVNHKLVSVTVMHPSAALADALATGLLIAGSVQALEIANKHDIAVFLINRTTDGFDTQYSNSFNEAYIH